MRAPLTRPTTGFSAIAPNVTLRAVGLVVFCLAGCARSSAGTVVDDELDASSSSSAAGDLDSSVLTPLDGAPGANSSASTDGGRSGDGAAGDASSADGGGSGCSSPVDSDLDGTPDCRDLCPNDCNKIAPGLCGCSVSDQDTDLDGVPDCKDTCSGKADQVYVVDSSCGVGYCRAHNVPSTCVAGVEKACAAGAPLHGSDSTCDGVDDDCDGSIDEDFGSMSSSCGVGVCAKTGSVTCVAGKVVDSCVAGTAPVSSDTSCNGQDDDCDGSTDEDYPTTASSCSAGACASTGTVTCTGGKVVDSCAARAPISSTDATCDNIDDDCDGSTDEDFKTTTSKCGVGACASTGAITCSKGHTVDSCKPASKPSSTDTTCNDVDDDCNGKVDDGYAATTTHCGLGACAASGTLSCASGATKDSCVAGTPKTTTDDAFTPGNGIDDDCDGMIDEDVPPCNTAPLTFEAGAYDNVVVPGNCHSVTVNLWGGGGAGGQEVGLNYSGGAGGPGGYATATALVNGTISLSVGAGGASGCDGAGSNAANASFNGGAGGSGAGDAGGDGSTGGGGSGAAPSGGQRGGDGHFGGGGGGAGNAGVIGSSGKGGGGGAASVLTINGVRAALAGGGGGAGGAQSGAVVLGSRGGDGGSGCSGDGKVNGSSGGGGGGGGLCVGASTQAGSGTTPASSGSLPGGRASGGSSSCNAGGPGYATLTFAH